MIVCSASERLALPDRASRALIARVQKKGGQKHEEKYFKVEIGEDNP